MTKSLICAPQRTAIGSFQGSLSALSAPQLGAAALQSTISKSQVSVEKIDEVYMGCVLSAGLGQAPARQASIAAGVSNLVPCTTVSKVCGSGLKAVMLADLSIRSGQNHAVLAGGMESMSNTPYLIPKMRSGLRMGNGELVDSMIKDGLWDVYNNFHMGTAAELCCQEHQITREAQDAYAERSYQRALNAIANGSFKNEIAQLSVQQGKKTISFEMDEEPARGDLSKFSQLKPVFDSKKGTITAANASSLSDGAAAMLICSESFSKSNQLKPTAQIVAQAQAAQDPVWFTTAPAKSIERLLKETGLKTSDIDLWEINEAFSAVSLVNIKLLGLDPEKVNVNGGAVSLGHPIGASGARILVTLCHALAQRKKRYGVASLCIGGGEAVAMLVENLER